MVSALKNFVKGSVLSGLARDTRDRPADRTGEPIWAQGVFLERISENIPMMGFVDAVFFCCGCPFCLPAEDLEDPAGQRALEALERRVVAVLLPGRGREPFRPDAEGQRAAARARPFDLREARKNAAWALGFWKGEREAIPTTRPDKCRVCEFRELCPASRFR